MSTSRPALQQGFLARTADRADRRMDRLPEDSSGLNWGLRATRDLTVFGLCLAAAETISFVRRKAGRR